MHSHTHSCCTDECVNTSVSLEIFLMTPQWHGYVTIHVDTRKKKQCMGNCLIKCSQTCSQSCSLAPVKVNVHHLFQHTEAKSFFFFLQERLGHK